MKNNVNDTEQKVRLALGSAAGAAAVWAPVRYKWKGVLSGVAVAGLMTGMTRFSPFKWLIGLRG